MAAVFSSLNYIFFSKNKYRFERRLMQKGDTELLLKSIHSNIKDGHAKNSHLGILSTISSWKPYVLLSINQATWRLRINKLILFKYQVDQERNSNLDILQTASSSKPYVLTRRKLIGCVRPKRDSKMLLSFLSDTNDWHALNSLLGIFQTTSSNPHILYSRNLMGGIIQHGD